MEREAPQAGRRARLPDRKQRGPRDLRFRSKKSAALPVLLLIRQILPRLSLQ